jgi:hypothetical protein
MKRKSLFRRRPQPLRQPDIYEAAELNAAIRTVERIAERYGLEAEVRFKLNRK